MTMRAEGRPAVIRPLAALAALVTGLFAGGPALAHPMGNFSISHYTAIRIEADTVRLRHVVDLAEIPTFQELQAHGITPDRSHPSVARYVERRLADLRGGLGLAVDGHPLDLGLERSEIAFPPGAGDLPTVRMGAVFHARLAPGAAGRPRELTFRDANFPDRVGWKEIIAGAGPGVTVVERSVPETDRSAELDAYPADPLASPPQDLAARIVFVGPAPGPPVIARPATSGPGTSQAARGRGAPAAGAAAPPATGEPAVRAEPGAAAPPARAGTPRSPFTQLIATPRLSPGVVLAALLVAASLGAFHALEPGHGKTMVAAYLVGSRGTAWHALLLGLTVTAAHTAGVYLLGAVTLYASRYIVPEQLYPWLGTLSGLVVAGLGLTLLFRRYAGARGHGHPHRHHHHDHHHDHDHGPGSHAHPHPHGAGPGAGSDGPVGLGALLTLGITGGMVPCPAALVVLLSAVALRRIGFGLLLIMAFSAGLAAVLIALGLLMVGARRFMSRLPGEGRLVTRWLPLTSAAVITLTGVAITLQALRAAGVLILRL
jgi:ABC-type nickel/cobalt efflux system permease component RcnA